MHFHISILLISLHLSVSFALHFMVCVPASERINNGLIIYFTYILSLISYIFTLFSVYSYVSIPRCPCVSREGRISHPDPCLSYTTSPLFLAIRVFPLSPFPPASRFPSKSGLVTAEHGAGPSRH